MFVRKVGNGPIQKIFSVLVMWVSLLVGAGEHLLSGIAVVFDHLVDLEAPGWVFQEHFGGDEYEADSRKGAVGIMLFQPGVPLGVDGLSLDSILGIVPIGDVTWACTVQGDGAKKDGQGMVFHESVFPWECGVFQSDNERSRGESGGWKGLSLIAEFRVGLYRLRVFHSGGAKGFAIGSFAMGAFR